MIVLQFGGSGQSPNHFHYKDFCVHPFNGRMAADMAVKDFLLQSPFQNASLIALLGTETANDKTIRALTFREGQGNIQAALVMQGDTIHVAPAKPQMLSVVVDALEQGVTAHGVAVAAPNPLKLEVCSSVTRSVMTAWNNVAERTSEVRPIVDFFHYDAKAGLVLPANNPVTARPATRADNAAIVEAATNAPHGSLAKRDCNELEAMRIKADVHNPYVIESDGLLRFAVYNVAPIGKSGALVGNSHMTIAADESLMAQGMPAIREALEPELKNHFAALAQTLQNEGRWTMFAAKQGGDVMPRAKLLNELGFGDADGMDKVSLKSNRLVLPAFT